MGFAFRLMAFTIGFNIALAIVVNIFGAGHLFISALDQNAGLDQVNSLDSQMNLPNGVPVQDQNIWYKLVDVINLGFINKIQSFLHSTIFSIPTMMVNIGLLDPDFRIYFDGMISIIFILGMFELFTGRDLFQR